MTDPVDTAVRTPRPAHRGTNPGRHPPLQRRGPRPDRPHHSLVAAGVNIAGITRILDLEDANTALRTAPKSVPASEVD
jgi:hypothetical protein